MNKDPQLMLAASTLVAAMIQSDPGIGRDYGLPTHSEVVLLVEEMYERLSNQK